MGNRVSTVSDVLTIRIGGETVAKKGAPRPSNNRIKSTKYTIITFLPQNLLEQFRRIANFYFLTMVVVSCLIVSPVSPLTSLIPLVFVISVTAAKQGYEDYLRYRADNMVNFSYVTVIRQGEIMDVRSQDVVLGDLVKAARDCDVPCDLVLLKSSDPHGKCHITTANLDGETNLKTLSVPKGLPDLGIDKIHTLGVIECEQPRTDLYTFNGRIELSSMHRRQRMSLSENAQHALPLSADNLLLRGSRIKNTEWAIGCAVYTGQNTKLSLNSRLTRNKMSSSEKYVNKFLVFFLLLLISWVTISYFLKRYYDNYVTEHNVYLGEIRESWAVSNFLQDYFSFLILFNYLIPISLYVTIEFHKFLGSFFMEWDPDLYDAETNQPFIVNTSDLNEELGQVKFLFSDKTGTLTKNEMILQRCSINGKMYTCSGSGIQQQDRVNVIKIAEFKNDVFDYFQTLSACHTVQVVADGVDEIFISDNEITNSTDELDEVMVMDEQTIRPAPGVHKMSMDLQETVQVVTQFHDIREESPDSNISLTLMHREFHDPNPNQTQCIHCKAILTAISYTGSTSNTFVCATCTTARLRPRPGGSPLAGRMRLPRPMSTEFKRAISYVDTEVNQKPQHRRTQSYVTPTTYARQKELNEIPSRTSISSRTSESVANLREFYVAPAFNPSTLLDRKESLRRRKAINSVVKKLDYQASSPDEKALVEGCARVGFLYIGEVNDTLTVKVQPFEGAFGRKVSNDSVLVFKRLATLEFTSDRKRMSTVVRDTKGQIWLLTKGAESHVLPLCETATARSQQLIADTQEHINEFARIGLRTLAVARRKLTEDEFENYEQDIIAANNSLTQRKERIEAVNSKLETNLTLLGATAVEDALQDNVKDTLESLRYAGIKVWVLTGDKVETALNIALSCGHIPEESEKYFITQANHPEEVNEHLNILELELNAKPDAMFSLLIDGGSLAIALKEFGPRFRDVAVRCRAVLCCRLSPLQKCEVVQLIKTCPGKPTTAAIGDGANDVSMIQEAHVGLGIVGKEGRQAARCGDYAFANFSMIKKVLLVHGYYYSHRLALLVLYFFYKNLVFMLLQFYFQMNSMFSSETLYDSLFLTLYNVMYTSLPVLFLSLTEKMYSEQKLMNNPSLYMDNEGNKRFYWKNFIGWMTLALYHSGVIYGSGYLVWTTNAAILPTPFTVNFYCFGTYMIHNVVVVVNLKLWLVAKYQSNWFIFTVIGSILVFMISTIVYNVLDPSISGDMLWAYFTLLSAPTVWLLLLFVLVASLLPDYVIKSFGSMGMTVSGIFPGKDHFRARKLFRYQRRTESTYL